MNYKTQRKPVPGYWVLLVAVLLSLPSIQLSAQRPKGGGGKAPSKPAASKPKSVSKPSGANKPSGINKHGSDQVIGY